MKPKVGEYYYLPHGRGFRIYRYDEVTETGFVASPAMDEETLFSRDEARKRVYELNGWKWKDDKRTTP